MTSVCYGWIEGLILPAPRQGVPIVARMRRSSAEHLRAVLSVPFTKVFIKL